MEPLAWGICLRLSTTICRPGDKIITPIQMLVGSFVFVGLVGLLWLGWRSRKRGL